MAGYIIILAMLVIGNEIYSTTCAVNPDWNYRLEGYTWNCTDTNIVSTNVRPKRDTNRDYGMNGTISIGQNIDNDYQIEVKIYYSRLGNSQYKLSPYAVQPCSFNYYMNKIYKPRLMPDLAKCSDLPVFEGEWNKPLEKGEYSLKFCQISTQYLPSHMNPGAYKVIYYLSKSSFRYVGELILKVEREV